MNGTDGPKVIGGKYHLIEKIATGGMAEVWRARQTGAAGFEKVVVIKKVLKHLAADEEFQRLFRDEARIAAALVHSNIVQVFELNAVDDEYFMAMEYVHGLDLSRLITRSRRLGPFPIPLALFITAEVLRALAFAHERVAENGEPLNVVHCDVSPQNILISYAGEVKLTDFGIARAALGSSQQNVVRGKYAYMSPEQVEGRQLDGLTDLFSLGIVLYETLTGRRLFKAKSRDETLARVRRAEVPSPRAYRPEISEDLEEFLLKALSRRKQDRYRDAAEMLDALNALMAREGHWATNNDLAAFLKEVIDSATAVDDAPRDSSKRSVRPLPPSAVVVLAVEASAPPRSIATPRTTLAQLTQEWSGLIAEAGGEVWERGEGSMLVVWVARGGLRNSLGRAVKTAEALQEATKRAGFRLSAGVCPGVARIAPDTRRPAPGWELAGPFYLARWMMNLSAHRGRILLTEVGARQVGGRTTPLGRVPIGEKSYINLYELESRR